MTDPEALPSTDRPQVTYRDLMLRRITEILLVSSLYDSFVMEEDGGLVEQISSKYLDLHLSRAPRLHRVSTAAEALAELAERRYDLVVTTQQLGDADAFAFGRRAKELYPEMPVVLLLHRMSEAAAARARGAETGVDHVFVWSGDSDVFLAMIKSLEDRMNVDHDTAAAGVRVILLVEDSPRYYSSFLPVLFSEIMRHCQAVLPEDVDTMHRLYRMRARPKILLARTSEEAGELCRRYREMLLAVVSDVQLPRGGTLDRRAGLELLAGSRAQGLEAPFLFLSAAEENREPVRELGAAFISKNSPSLVYELREFISGSLGFGAFVFRLPDGREVARAADIDELAAVLSGLPAESLRHHLERRHFANWFMARGEFALAEAVGRRWRGGCPDAEEARSFLIAAVTRNAADRRRGRISDFSPQGLGQPSFLMRLGRGSLGGKSRGLAFMAQMLGRHDLSAEFPGAAVRIPRTVAVAVDVFDRFVAENDLQRFTAEERPDEDVAAAFLAGELPGELAEGLDVLLEKVHYPLAVRSSSLLEDSYNIPFAGIYSTYMLPNAAPDPAVRRDQLHRAVKLVYASVFFAGARRYHESVNVHIAEEKMGIVVQETVGRRHGERFYPDISGVAHSWNFYAAGRLRPEDGVAHVALGLGRMVTDDGVALRFSPARPRALPQFGTVRDWLDQTQKDFYALDLGRAAMPPGVNDGANLLRCTLADAEADGALEHVGAVYLPEEDAIRDGLSGSGPRLVNFGNVLRHGAFPLAGLVRRFLEIGQSGMGCPVEIEFAVRMPPPGEGAPEFHLLQIRPMFAAGEEVAVDLSGVDESRVLCRSRSTLSNGEISGICDVVYVRPESFDPLRTVQIAAEFARVNEKLLAERRPYLAIGMGRWGTAEPSLGIPVSWPQICGARALVETGRPDYVVDPSQGTHFLQNLTSLQVAHLDVHPEHDRMDWDWLAAQEVVEDLRYVRHARTAGPLRVLVDGRIREGVVLTS